MRCNSEIIDFTVSQQSKQNDNASNLIEMEDMSPKKAIVKKQKTPNKNNQVNTTTNKRKTNNIQQVTLQMHNNLNNTVNQIDDEIQNFATRYQHEQQQIMYLRM